MLRRKKNLYASLENQEVDGENTSTDQIGGEALNRRVEDRHEESSTEYIFLRGPRRAVSIVRLKSGAPRRNRTYNLWIKSPLLCQLS